MNDPKTGHISWYSPDPRAHIPLDQFHVSRSLRKLLKKKTPQHFSLNVCFELTIRNCADREDTWLDERLISAFVRLHTLGFAHSIEVWADEDRKHLAGGLYGLALGRAFFAESMFSKETNGSKMALFSLVQRLNKNGYHLLETQFLTPHLASLGGVELSAKEYSQRLSAALKDIGTKRPLDL